MNKSSVFSAQRSTSSQIVYCVLVRYTRTRNQTLHGNKDGSGSKHLRSPETCSELTASQWNSIGIFSRIQSVAAQSRSPKLRLDETPENFTGRVIFMSMFIDSHRDQETTK